MRLNKFTITLMIIALIYFILDRTGLIDVMLSQPTSQSEIPQVGSFGGTGLLFSH